jgi:hypothetical protein
MIKIPILPLSTLIFYSMLVLLWNLGIIPSPKELIGILEVFYEQFGYFGLVMATFLEGISYICLYVPGAFIIAITVFFSDGSLASLLTISAIVSATLTFDAFINYYLGVYVSSRKKGAKNVLPEKPKNLPRGFFASMIHPNFLAFYFLNLGLKGRSPKQILYVPLVMFPYGMLAAYILATFSSPIRQGMESPSLMLTILIVWFVVAFWKDNKLGGKLKNLLTS